MRLTTRFLLVLLILVSCDDDNSEIEPEPEPDPCSVLVDGVYVYPGLEDLPDTTWSSEQRFEFFYNIPEKVIECFTTAGLVESCFNIPHFVFMMGYDGYQSAYDFFKRTNRGFAELERREDAPRAMIDKYATVDLTTVAGGPKFELKMRLQCLEVAMAQIVILEKLTVEDKIVLVSLAINHQNIKREDQGIDPEHEQYSNYRLHFDGSSALLSRLMYVHEYPPFIEAVEASDELMAIIEGYTRNYIWIDYADIIIEYAETFLDELM